LQRIIAYFDGFNLYFGLKSKGWKRYYWLNPHLLAENLLKPGQQLDGIKYFTARISQNPRDPNKHKRQATWLEAIEMLANTSVYYGHYLSKTQKCNNCGSSWITHEEKMTDVNIAVELMNDAYDGAFDTAFLFSADSDLTTPVKTILSRFPDKRIIVICPPGRQSKELEGVSSASLRLGRKVLQNSQLDNEIIKPDGFVLKRPGQWS
jgi:hypothetical protein